MSRCHLGDRYAHSQRVMATRNRSAIRHFGPVNNQSQMVSRAVLLACRDTPLAPLADYEAWVDEHITAQGHPSVDARKLRRIAQMKRNGCDGTEIATAIGTRSRTVSRWYSRLPQGLR